ncbi:MAG: hypothetical protein PHE09_21295 [Oscillospiraceae bacterium]|nr:hypothetical protein [Oscillospiraceae bacterium]
MIYHILNAGTDMAGHRFLQLQHKEKGTIVAAVDTEIEMRKLCGKIVYILKAITQDDRRIWLWITGDPMAAYHKKDDLDRLLESI